MIEYLIHYTIVYLIGYLISLTLDKRDDFMNIFTRVISTINAIYCVYYVTYINFNYLDLFNSGHDEFVKDLYRFASYLIVDGIYNLIKFNTIDKTIHHFVGGLGITLIAYNRQGLGLGAYFAATEISTPLLNISWILYSYNVKGIFTIIIFCSFYLTFIICRIFTTPLLIYYIYINNNKINTLGFLNYWMVYFGSSTLVLLNIIWGIMLSKRISKIYIKRN